MEEYTPSKELETVIRPACEKAREQLTKNGPFKSGQWHVGSTDYDQHPYSDTVRLRLDWELDAPTVNAEGALTGHTLDLMYTQVASDLDDLFQNGDRDRISDPLLSSTDGSRKTGKRLVGLDIVEQHLVVVFAQRKDTYEYTLYMNMVPTWE